MTISHLLLTAILAVSVITWFTPDLCRLLAIFLLARAYAVEVYRLDFKERLRVLRIRYQPLMGYGVAEEEEKEDQR